MAMNPDSIVKCFDVFPYQRVCGIEIGDTESIKPFTLYQRMERFYTGVIVWVAFMRVAPLHALCGFSVGLADVLAASVRVMPNSG